MTTLTKEPITLRNELKERSLVLSKTSSIILTNNPIDVKDLTTSKENVSGNYNLPMLSEKEEETLLDQLGFKSIVEKQKRNRKQNEYLRKYGSLIKTKDILEVAEQYGLVLLPTKFYISEIGEDTLKLSKKFLKETHIEDPAFFILAPPEKFNLDSLRREQDEERLAELRRLDPSLFTYIGEDLWLMIDSWGDDFTEERKKEVKANKKSYNVSESGFLNLITLVNGVIVVLMAIWFGMTFKHIVENNLVSYLSTTGAFFVSFLYLVNLVGGGHDPSNSYRIYLNARSMMNRTFNNDKRLKGIKI